MATGADYEVIDVSSGEEITNPGANDVMVAFHKSTGALEKIDYNKLAKAIIEQYTGSTIGGSARSVKAALDVTAQSKIVDLDSVAADLTVIGVYYCPRWADKPNGETASGYVINIPHATNANLRKQFYIPYATEVVYIRGKFDSSGFTDWKKQPTRDETDAKVSGKRQAWGTTLTFDCSVNGRFLVLAGNTGMYTGINYSDNLAFNNLVKSSDNITATASRSSETSITVTTSASANITAFCI